MGSQNKVATYDELVHYFELKKIPAETDFIIQPKCDGLSLEIRYEKGRVVDAVTRGDGLVGDLITQNVVKMKNFIEQPKNNFTGSIRCEIVVYFDDFKKLNKIASSSVTPRDDVIASETKQSHPEGFLYSNTRNAASGISQRLDSKFSQFCTLLAVDLFVETPRRCGVSLPKITTELDKINLIKKLGFIPVETHHCLSYTDIEKIYQDFLIQKRRCYPFDIDGLVVKINNLPLQQQLGAHDNHPKGQVAYKFPAATNQTRILSVNWQVGPLGTITPVAQVEPIEISGAVITFASLANFDLIKEKNINIGDIVQISRRGDVIPHIEKIISKVNPGHLSAPVYCPSCRTKLIQDHKFLRCPNTKTCLAQILGALRLFCDTLEIKGISEKTITKLYQAKKIRLPGDFYQLTISDFPNLEGLGEKSGNNIVHQIQSKRRLTLAQVIDAAIIPNFSHARIKQIVDAGFNTPDKILNLTIGDLLSLKGFQKTLAQKIVDGITLRRTRIESILSQVQIKNFELKFKNLALKGIIFAITGDLSQPRKEIEKLIESRGGKVQSTVSSTTNYLITNLPAGRHGEPSSGKFQSAKKFGTKIISESQLRQLLQ